MFRKVLHIMLAQLLFISTMGITVHKHYMHGELFDVSFFVEVAEDNSYGDCQKKCCVSTVQSYRLDVDFTVTETASMQDQVPLYVIPSLVVSPSVGSDFVVVCDSEIPHSGPLPILSSGDRCAQLSSYLC